MISVQAMLKRGHPFVNVGSPVIILVHSSIKL